MQGFTAFLIYISIFVKQKGIAMKTTAEIIEILRDYKARSAEKYGSRAAPGGRHKQQTKHWAFSVAWLVVNRMRRVTSMCLLS